MMLAISQPVVDHSQAKMIKWKTSDQIPVFDLKKKMFSFQKNGNVQFFPCIPELVARIFIEHPQLGVSEPVLARHFLGRSPYFQIGFHQLFGCYKSLVN
jgi:hypothetical protein